MKIFKSKIEKNKENSVGTIISENIKIFGNIEGQDSIRIDGYVEGELKIESQVIIGKTGYIKGNITCSNVYSSGKIEGNILCREKVEIFNTSIILGNISASKVVLHEGAIIRGSIDNKSDEI